MLCMYVCMYIVTTHVSQPKKTTSESGAYLPQHVPQMIGRPIILYCTPPPPPPPPRSLGGDPHKKKKKKREQAAFTLLLILGYIYNNTTPLPPPTRQEPRIHLRKNKKKLKN